MKLARGVAAFVCVMMASGCGPEPEQPCPSVPRLGVSVTSPADVDLLLVVDSRESMSEEIGWLAAEWSRFLERVATGDHDGDGTAERPRPGTVQAGVVTADMGTAGFALWDTCKPPHDFGDDAVLRTSSSGPPECEESYPPFVVYEPGVGEVATRAVPCVLESLEPACEFPQPLHAMLKAIAARGDARPNSFAMGTTGHGDGANAGFLRPGGLLAVVFLTNADDCSVSDIEFFDSRRPELAGTGTFRCVANPDPLTSLQTVTSGLSWVDDLHAVFFGVVAGVPPDLVGTGRSITADDRMQPREDSEVPGTVAPACEGPHGPAEPAQRLVRFVETEVDRDISRVASICADPSTDPLATIADGISEALGRACLRPGLPAGLEGCRLVTVHNTRDEVCTPPERDLGLRDGRRYCEIEPAPAPGEPGWWLDTSSEETARLCTEPTSGRLLLSGISRHASVRLECPRLACANDGDCAEHTALGGEELRCHDGHCCRRP